jgi:hypothetical protein
MKGEIHEGPQKQQFSVQLYSIKKDDMTRGFFTNSEDAVQAFHGTHNNDGQTRKR